MNQNQNQKNPGEPKPKPKPKSDEPEPPTDCEGHYEHTKCNTLYTDRNYKPCGYGYSYDKWVQTKKPSINGKSCSEVKKNNNLPYRQRCKLKTDRPCNCESGWLTGKIQKGSNDPDNLRKYCDKYPEQSVTAYWGQLREGVQSYDGFLKTPAPACPPGKPNKVIQCTNKDEIEELTKAGHFVYERDLLTQRMNDTTSLYN